MKPTMRFPFLVTGSLFLVTLFVSSCGFFRSSRDRDTDRPSSGASAHRSGSGEAKAPEVSLTFDDSVTDYYKNYIQKDLRILSDAGLTDSTDSAVLDISGFDNMSLHDWLSLRLKIIVGLYFSSYSYSVEKYNVTYPSDTLFNAASDSGVTMSNFGALLYSQGRDNGRVYSVNAGGSKQIINSPRVGIIKIHDSFLSARKVKGSDYADDVNSYFRISTLFHEGRHSDGHGKDSILPHATCESGTYYGKPACDRYTNGPYSVAKVLLQKFRAICGHCNSNEKSALDLYIADNASRVLPTAQRLSDVSPETVSY